MTPRVAWLVAGCVLALASCGDEVASVDGDAPPDGGEEQTDAPSAEPAAAATPLAALPAGDLGTWTRTLGAPVVAAVRTSTPLARLDGVAAGERLASCRLVATDLDTIASPGQLLALTATADAETATLLTADLEAKRDLLAVCDRDDATTDALVAEVAATHDVAVRWLTALVGDA